MSERKRSEIWPPFWLLNLMAAGAGGLVAGILWLTTDLSFLLGIAVWALSASAVFMLGTVWYNHLTAKYLREAAMWSAKTDAIWLGRKRNGGAS